MSGGPAPGVVPFCWFEAPAPLAEITIIVNWLNIEVEPTAPIRWPILHQLSGWRNREIYEFVSGPQSWDWTARIYAG